MFIAKCPLRISLIGGSTDLQPFLDKYVRGCVISFPSNRFAYISVHDNHRGKYYLNYSKNEEVDSIEEIHNDVARVVLEHFKVGPITVSFESDILSTGTGLASSSAYMIAMIKALSMYTGQHLTEFEICKKALELERMFNPRTGQQDTYGCGIGGFKRIDFHLRNDPSFRFLSAKFLEEFDMALYHTGISRSSTKILKTFDTEKSFPLLQKVEELESHIVNKNVKGFLNVFNQGWEIKKKLSPLIVGNPEFQQWDEAFKRTPEILGVKLCGAGAGGYFLALCKKGHVPKEVNGSAAIAIQVNEAGVTGQHF